MQVHGLKWERESTSSVSGQPYTAIDLQVLAVLSDVHLFALEELQTQMQVHGLKWERESTSRLFEGDKRDHGVLGHPRRRRFLETHLPANFFSHVGNFSSTVLCRYSSSNQRVLQASSKLRADVCIAVAQFAVSGHLHQVGSHNFCRDIVAVSSVVDLAVDPEEFVGVFQRGPDVQMITSDSSSSSSSSQPDPISLKDCSSRHIPITFVDDTAQIGATTTAHISMHSAGVTASDYTEALAQLRTSVDNISHEQMQIRFHVEILKADLSKRIFHLETTLIAASESHDRAVLIQTDILRKEMKEQKAALFQDMDDKLKGVQYQQAALSHDLMELQMVMPKRGREVAAEVRSLLLMIVADLVLVMEEADLAEVWIFE
ncbi:hypothetical protein F511_23603 [Dorcoceras hygrometricum]|uniref:Uncharacterized protein n=1 Tax=Dorcoceras hygrometricum TaxID=472368 RepID=A0A2Z7CMA6_9LAMI|nr:hypothetical protein F511_23603 [Dorcoceras hygrometricum]